MPSLTAYFDTTGSSFYIQKSKTISEILNFPYVYSEGLFSNQYSKEEFFKLLIEKILSDRNINKSRCNILVSGFIEPPELDLKAKYSIGVVDLIESSIDFVPVFINNCSFLTRGVLSSFSFCGNKSGESKVEFGDGDQLANLCIYPNVVPEDISAQSALDAQAFKRIPKDFKFESGRKLIFTGGRFSQPIMDMGLNYILMLDCLRGYGFFNVYQDNFNIFSLSKTMKMYDRDTDTPDFSAVEKTGTFIRTGGAAECLLSTGLGNDQFIEIEENKIFVLPLRLQKPAKLSVKSSVLGTIDIITEGGEVGLVFDTRSEEKSIYSDVKFFNDCIRQFSDINKEKIK
jgi:hypothetical protein